MLKFKNIRLKEKNIKLLFKWRKQDFVQNNSLTKISNSYSKHKKWFIESINKIDYHHWFVFYKHKKIGWICITEPNFKDNTLRWGYYIGEKKYMFVGGIVPCYLYNFIFKNLNFKNILAETLEHNKMVDEILKLHGFRKTETVKSQLTKKNKYTLRTNYKLSKNNWQKNNHFNIYEDVFFLPKKKVKYFKNEKEI